MKEKRIIYPATHNFNFAITKAVQSSSDSMTFSHYHDMYEIYYLWEGEKYCFIKDKYYKLQKGSLVFVNRYDLHYMTASPNEGAVRFHILFRKEYIKEFFDSFNLNLLECFECDNHILNLSDEQRQIVEPIILALFNEFRRKPDGFRIYIKSLLLQLLLIFARNTKDTGFLPESTEYFDEAHKTVSQAIVYINNNFREHISLDFLAEKFFISPSYFSKIFREISGNTFTDYLNGVRIKEAQRLMHETNMSIAQIAKKIGYNSSTHFGRTFKNHTGLSPLSYKKSK